MLLPRICLRVSKLYQMTAQLNYFLVFSPITSEKPFSTQNPSCISLKFRVFCSSHNPKLSRSLSTQSHTAHFGSRVSRVALSEAQGVLFDYLHLTRSFSFTDAEHISKNSPQFLQNLLSKFDNDEHISRSLGKFLRYNPINEFEPFFESLGLCPSEISSLLPRHLLFLSDDRLLLENFYVLCNYGVPRSKIGKIYREARDIFKNESGSLSLKFQAYENLGLSRTTVIKLACCCPCLLISDLDNGFVNVLERSNRFGIESNRIGGYLSWKRSYDWKRILDTLDFLEKVGYSEEQLHSLFETNPQLVLEGSGKRVYVLFGRLLKLGLKTNEVHSLFIENPQLLSAKCEKNLLRSLNFFLYIGMEAEEIAPIVSKHMEFLCSNRLKGPKILCKDLGIKKDTLCEIARQEPAKFLSLAAKSKVIQSEQVSRDARTEKTAFLLRLGYVENSDEMMRALKKFRGRGDQLQERFDCLVQAGLDCDTVTSLVKHVPMVLNQTKDVMEKKIDCLTNYLRYPLSSVVAFPAYLCYDLERINHRFRMYIWLRDRGAAKGTLSLSTILACSDVRFVKYFVDVHPEAPAMWGSLRNASSES